MSSSLRSKPPVAITTLGAVTSLRPSAVSKTTPVISPSARSSSDGSVAGLRLDASIQACPQQPPTEREAHTALIVGGAACHLLGLERLGDGHAECRLADRQVIGRVVRRDVDAVSPLAELTIRDTEAVSSERPPFGMPPILLGVVVGEVGDGVELHRRALVQPT